jgi:hypothetical protein
LREIASNFWPGGGYGVSAGNQSAERRATVEGYDNHGNAKWSDRGCKWPIKVTRRSDPLLTRQLVQVFDELPVYPRNVGKAARRV